MRGSSDPRDLDRPNRNIALQNRYRSRVLQKMVFAVIKRERPTLLVGSSQQQDRKQGKNLLPEPALFLRRRQGTLPLRIFSRTPSKATKTYGTRTERDRPGFGTSNTCSPPISSKMGCSGAGALVSGQSLPVILVQHAIWWSSELCSRSALGWHKGGRLVRATRHCAWAAGGKIGSP